MRVAVLSLMEAAGDVPGSLRGYLSIGGRSLLRHQLGFALSLGCKRIIVMSEGISGELVALQHVAEAGGAQFHVVATARALVPLLPPDDDVFVLGDGLLAMPDAVRELLEAGPAVLTLPVETALPLGFERIDINNAFAAAMRFPGRIAAGLADLPPEWNAQSALLRLVVQARVPLRGVPAGMLDDGRWNIVRNEEEALRAERSWLRLHTGIAVAGAASPGEMLAVAAVRRFGPALLHAGTRPALVGLAAGVLGLLGGGLAWLGNFAAGFALLGLAWLAERIASLLGQVERDSLLASGIERRGVALFHLLVDAGIVALAGWRSDLANVPKVPWGGAMFAPLLLVLALRLVPLALPRRKWAHQLEDRFVLGLALAAVSIVLPFDLAVAAGVILVVGACLLALQAESRDPNPQLTSRQ
ncbi:hypothetical protein Saro_2036 [Novosphingobium aromaticivorans DSM 12444]|uniref:Uncharacterized protein n=1 Tax=Novosphingobium aromaticivorans (strain ATCC 700278 / DSM 12444 / CCUG 56034 / CIP 105152 / NBRC 16084 / F199) TaxID=279238 RepID=Q2G6P8_NOVAD|nr:hypothetical protein Saro_2036 [Novosphingobium aromaticivorans DSM 12444]SCY77249.1 hypothetical protein SAMN05660666_02854 [Novosphingobium aromaticivorans]